MLVHPQIDPVAIAIGPLKVHWYGLTYLAGFALFWWIQVRRTRLAHIKAAGWTSQEVSDVLFAGVMGVVLGGRIGYVLFYNFGAFLDNPLYLFKVWEGGMSFHGGFLGVLVAMWWHGRQTGRRWWDIVDFVAPAVPVGLMTGRLGNFINGELWGRVTDVPWGMVFPHVGPEPRHPSQLYEAGLEGLALLLILLWFARRPRPTMAVSGLFLLLYGLFRSFVEFFRTPDAHIGFVAANWITMGQVLSVPMIIGGIVILALAYSRQDR